MKRRGIGLVLAAAIVGAVTNAPTAAARAPERQDIIDGEIEDGTYTGTIHIHGGFTFPLNGGDAFFLSAIDGEAELVAAGGAITGSWTYTGTGNGGFSSLGVDATSESVYDGAGTFGGTATAARVLGTNNVTSTASFQGTSQTISDSQAIDELLENVLAGCGQVVGTFTLRINQEIEAQIPGASSFIRGTVALYSEPQTDDAAELGRRAAEIEALADGDFGSRVVLAADLLIDIERLQAEINATSSCPSTKEYFNQLTNVAARVLADVLNELDAIAAEDPAEAARLTADFFYPLVRLGTSTGAMGSGAVGGRGADLMDTARAQAQAAVDQLLEDDDFTRIGVLASLSAQMGWNITVGDISDSDAANTFGSDG